MNDRLLTRKTAGELLAMSPKRAAAFLREQGLAPIDFGLGRSGGDRWLESSVISLLRKMEQEAQLKQRQRKPKVQTIGLASMSAGDVCKMINARMQ